MAELADAADSKSAEVHPSWGFNSPSRHQSPLKMMASIGVLPLRQSQGQDFASGLSPHHAKIGRAGDPGLPLRSRPQDGSSSTPPPGTIVSSSSFHVEVLRASRSADGEILRSVAKSPASPFGTLGAGSAGSPLR